MTVAVRFEHINKSLDSQSILKDLNLDVEKGKTTVLLGPSGAGKSTLLRLAVGLIKPDSGTIWAMGEKVSSLSTRALLLLRKRFGMLFQDGALFHNLSVFRNIALPLEYHRHLGEQKLRESVEQLLALVGLEGFGNRMPHSLSGGQKKRVALARALALNPEVVFFDEPTSGLDPESAANITNLIKDLQHRLGTTFLIITHDMKSALQMADFVAVLRDGQIVQYGSIDEVAVG